MTRWSTFKTENYTFIYPSKIDSLARHYAAAMELYRASALAGTGADPGRLPVILHAESAYSNGVVVWAPKRIELYTTPSDDPHYLTDWAVSLATHEIRHTGQMANLTQGLTKWLSPLLGESAMGISSLLFPNKLYLEGDAVVSETQLTEDGRGRNAEFLQHFRASFLNGDFRTYPRWKMGSFKKYTPNHYKVGYLLTACATLQSGNAGFSGDYIRERMRKPFSKNSYYSQEGLDGVKEKMLPIWEAEQKRRAPFTESDRITVSKRLYTDFTSVATLPGRDELYAVRSGMGNVNELVEVTRSGKEKRVRAFSTGASDIKTGMGRLWWSEPVTLSMFPVSAFSQIKYYDPEKRRSGTIPGRRLYSPAPVEGMNLIAAAHYPVEGSSYLVLLDLEGNEKGRFEAPGKGQIKEVVSDGENIWCTVADADGLALWKHAASGWKLSVAPQHRTINSMTATSEGIFFTSDLDGVQDIYLFRTESGKLERVVTSEFGAAYPAIGDTTLFFSEFATDGYHISSLDLTDVKRTPADFSKPYLHPLAEELTALCTEHKAKSDFNPDLYQDKEKYPSKRYRKATHLLHFHSFAPIYYNVDKILAANFEKIYDVASPGAVLYSQNSLGTATSMVGYSYAYGRHQGHFDFTYKGVVPAMELSVDLNGAERSSHNIYVDENNHLRDTIMPVAGLFCSTNVKFWIPFRFYSNGWYRSVTPQLSWKHSNNRYNFSRLDRSCSYNLFTYGITASIVSQTAKNAIFPRWGIGAQALWATSFEKGSYPFFCPISYQMVYGYMPGLFPGTGMKFSLAMQQCDLADGTIFLNRLAAFPRGYTTGYIDQNYMKVTVDYAIPIYLGDLSLGKILYLKRLQLIPFGDYSNIGMSSIGCDLLIDGNAMEMSESFSAGVRYSHTAPQSGRRNTFELLFSIDF